jgi:hypothetical protein
MAETLAAALILAVGMGVGRFAFTGMYPLMVRDRVISVRAGSLAASANYAGYLVGALLVSYAKHSSSARLCKLALLGTLACLAALAIHGGAEFVIGVRFVAGMLSAVTMICASVWLFHSVGYHHGAPVLYAGVGSGIVISAELIALGNRLAYVSSTVWIGLGVVGALICALAWPSLKGASEARSASEFASQSALQSASQADDTPSAIDARPMLAPWTLVAVYGLAGFGYIVTATYLPLFVKDALGNFDPVHLWAAFGLGAAPSCFLWHALHRRLGVRASLALNLIVQAVGVVVPTLSATPLSYLASAILVGGTFMGTVTIAMPAAKHMAVKTRFNVMATMTAAYGVGQIAGPLVSNALIAHTHSFDQPLLCAGGALVVGAFVCLI